MWTAIVKLLGFVWGLVFPPKGDPSTDQLVDSNARAQDQLAEEKTANAIDSQADATRIAGDTAVLHDLTATQPGAVDGAANTAIKHDLPDAFRAD